MDLRRIVARITAWWAARRVAKALPEVAELQRQIEARRRKHQPVRHLQNSLRTHIRNQLAREQGKRLSERTFP